MNQFDRRNAYNRAKLALELEHIFRAKARENIVEGGRKGGNIAQGKPSQNSVDPSKPIDTQKEVAKVANISHDTISKVKFIEKVAPEQMKERLEKQEVSINQVYQQLKKEEIKQKRKEEI